MALLDLQKAFGGWAQMIELHSGLDPIRLVEYR